MPETIQMSPSCVHRAARVPSAKKSMPPKRTRRFHGLSVGAVIESVAYAPSGVALVFNTPLVTTASGQRAGPPFVNATIVGFSLAKPATFDWFAASPVHVSTLNVAAAVPFAIFSTAREPPSTSSDTPFGAPESEIHVTFVPDVSVSALPSAFTVAPSTSASSAIKFAFAFFVWNVRVNATSPAFTNAPGCS
jgi:hypothetical protein